MATKKAGRWGLFTPFLIAGVLFGGYTAYWFVVARTIQAQAPAIMAALNADTGSPWRYSYETLTVTGFPYRFAIDLEAPTATDREAGQTWRVEAARATVLPYNLFHAVIQARGDVIGERGGVRDTVVRHENATFGVRYTAQGAVKDAAFSADRIEIETGAGGRLQIEAPSLQLGLAPSDPSVTRVQAQAETIAADGALSAVLLGHENAQTLFLALEARWAEGRDGEGLALIQPLPTGAYRVLGLGGVLGGSTLQVTGDGFVDETGRLIGRADVSASDLGFLDNVVGGDARNALRLATMLSGDLKLPVAFEEDRTTLLGVRAYGPVYIVRP